jgi:UDPglucose 6-dehydrogenase
MNILIVGTGYVGLVSGACFSNLGHQVICVDNDSTKIESLLQGQIPFYEPGLPELVKQNRDAGRLHFSTSLSENLNNADIVFIAVGTPPKSTGQADLKYVFQVAEEIGQNLNKYVVVTTKSTVPVGTSQKVKKIIKRFYSDEFDVASCPEFLREGSAIEDFSKPDRIVYGTESDRAARVLAEVHEKLDCEKISTTVATSEMIKYASNAFLATKISFINEMANVCENTGADVTLVSKGMGLDSRIGPKFLNAGLGYGGSCFPKDVRALHHIAGQSGYPFQLLRSVIEVNNQQRWNFYKKIRKELGSLEDKTIGVWGLSFKPNTDDIRESIAIDLIEKLLEDGARIKAHDPEAMKNTQELLKDNIEYCFSPEYAAEKVDCLLIITEWDEFKKVDLNAIKSTMNSPIIIDGRNLYKPDEVKQLGFKYISVGRS